LIEIFPIKLERCSIFKRFFVLSAYHKENKFFPTYEDQSQLMIINASRFSPKVSAIFIGL